MEYIIVDDFSNDKTTEKIATFALQNPNTKWVRNQSNLGLASSSNIALKMARGKYIMRIDADDFFVTSNSCQEMLIAIHEGNLEAVYPNNYFGDYEQIQKGREEHHVGGAIFDKRAINYIKFSDGLRGYEGLDFFTRAQDKLKIGYLNRAIFFYTQRVDSMSKTNLEMRAQIKRRIEEERIVESP
jgi:glycosyltransferase involved in cell wall biosynthesis